MADIDQWKPDDDDAAARDSPRPLSYATPTPHRGLPFSVRWSIGCFGYIFLTIMWFVGAAWLQAPTSAAGLPPWSALAGWGLMTIGLLGIALWLRVRFGSGYGYGILSALLSGVLLIGGLILLIIATCGR